MATRGQIKMGHKRFGIDLEDYTEEQASKILSALGHKQIETKKGLGIGSRVHYKGVPSQTGTIEKNIKYNHLGLKVRWDKSLSSTRRMFISYVNPATLVLISDETQDES